MTTAPIPELSGHPITPVQVAQYAELHCVSSFTFLRGASQPEELVARAKELGYSALAITDECSVAGVVRAHTKAKEIGFKLIVGSEFRLVCGLHLVVLALSRAGYGSLCRLITRGRRAAEKGEYRLERSDVTELLGDALDTVLLWLPPTAVGQAGRGCWFGADAGRGRVGARALHRTRLDCGRAAAGRHGAWLVGAAY